MLRDDVLKIFEEQKLVLKGTRDFLSKIDSFSTVDISEEIKNLMDNTSYLLKNIKKIVLINESQNLELITKQMELENILTSSNQCFIIVDTNFNVYKMYETALSQLFEVHYTDIFTLLKLNDPIVIENFKNALINLSKSIYLEVIDPLGFNLPQQLELYDRFWNIEYKTINNVSEDMNKIFLMITLTELKVELVPQDNFESDEKIESYKIIKSEGNYEFEEKIESHKITKLEDNVESDKVTSLEEKFEFNKTTGLEGIFESKKVSWLEEKFAHQENVDYLNVKDKLSTLYNKTYIDLSINKLKENGPIGLIYGDMNGLKLANDVFGHADGDEMISKLSNILLESCFKDEIVVRWSGDEFLIVVFNATNEVCEIISKRIKTKCINEKWITIVPSIALGYSIQETEEFDFESLFYRAIQQMYENKLEERDLIKKQFSKNIERIILDKAIVTEKQLKNMEKLFVKFNESAMLFENERDFIDALYSVRLYKAGMISLPSNTFEKNNALSDAEFELYKSHSQVGFRLFQSVELISIANNILYMYERWDGKGNTYGLKKAEIPFVSRILAILDTFDRKTKHTYLDGISDLDTVLKEIKSKGGTIFDPDLVNKFVKVFD